MFLARSSFSSSVVSNSYYNFYVWTQASCCEEIPSMPVLQGLCFICLWPLKDESTIIVKTQTLVAISVKRSLQEPGWSQCSRPCRRRYTVPLKIEAPLSWRRRNSSSTSRSSVGSSKLKNICVFFVGKKLLSLYSFKNDFAQKEDSYSWNIPQKGNFSNLQDVVMVTGVTR